MDRTRFAPKFVWVLSMLGMVVVPGGSRVLEAELPADQQIDQLQVCQDCHDLSDELQAGVDHAPVAAGECTACHNPHASRFAKLLLDRPGPLCDKCHPSVAREQGLATVHKPVAEGQCSDCHSPHGSSHRDLLVASGSELCSNCHESIASWRSKSNQHSPFAQGDCGTCHEPHASNTDGLLKTAGSGVCQSCHSFDEPFRQAHAGYPVQNASCQTCHDPHASSRQGLFRETVHEAFASGDCQTCHQGGSAKNPFALVKSGDELCADCHQDVVLANASAPFSHASGASSCTSCHNPHAGEGAGMLRRDLTATCLECHDPGGASAGFEGRYTTHAGEVECTACHSPHGSEWPLLSPQDPIDVCGECHTHEHGVRHPLGEETLDPRNGTPMDCSSCHGVHYAPFDDYLLASDSGDLCLDCHREIGGGRS